MPSSLPNFNYLYQKYKTKYYNQLAGMEHQDSLNHRMSPSLTDHIPANTDPDQHISSFLNPSELSSLTQTERSRHTLIRDGKASDCGDLAPYRHNIPCHKPIYRKNRDNPDITYICCGDPVNLRVTMEWKTRHDMLLSDVTINIRLPVSSQLQDIVTVALDSYRTARYVTSTASNDPHAHQYDPENEQQLYSGDRVAMRMGYEHQHTQLRWIRIINSEGSYLVRNWEQLLTNVTDNQGQPVNITSETQIILPMRSGGPSYWLPGYGKGALGLEGYHYIIDEEGRLISHVPPVFFRNRDEPPGTV